MVRSATAGAAHRHRPDLSVREPRWLRTAGVARRNGQHNGAAVGGRAADYVDAGSRPHAADVDLTRRPSRGLY
jgi:hypothetical protein